MPPIRTPSTKPKNRSVLPYLTPAQVISRHEAQVAAKEKAEQLTNNASSMQKSTSFDGIKKGLMWILGDRTFLECDGRVTVVTNGKGVKEDDVFGPK
ncbi:Protein of unknown function [Pyronema omphalodes CBS 100304]|uniref:Uncharacterized protein n=1 Tax=Pyronema omphalodes (strain CBS 100304) TaxID=1076935 RepID=U4LVQ5_PYROM|nr:Protein of unknown function [Pyronema omphalodes CBS 100304]